MKQQGTKKDIQDFDIATELCVPNGKELPRAEKILKRILKKYGSNKETHLNLGNVYRLMDEDEKAFYHYKQSCLDTTPFLSDNNASKPWDMGWTNLGLLTYDHGDDELASMYYRKAMEINPQNYNNYWNWGLSHLRRWSNGEDVDPSFGWKLYNYRFIKQDDPAQLNTNVKIWDGVTPVRKLCVLAEQGTGDRIHFGRYIKVLEDYCEQLMVECHPSMDVFFEDYHIVRQGDAWDCDYGVPICSLPGMFGHQPHDWLKSVNAEAKPLPPGSVIVEWTGNPEHANSRHRNTQSSYFSNIFTGPNVYSFHDKDHDNIKGLGQKDWRTTCGYLKSCSLVVTVDTALAHVSGSMGIPTIVIQPRKNTDFRWGRGGLGMDNIWYPNIKVIHNPGTWEATFNNLKEYLVANNQPTGY